MKRTSLGADEIRTFLEAADRHLSMPAKIILIGGGAATLAYGATSATGDLDTLNKLSKELQRAFKEANAETGLNVPVSLSGVASPPEDYEDRLERILPKLKKLEVWTLEKHDLVLSKVIRWAESDQQHIREINRSVGLSFDVLVERFRDEVHDKVVGDPKRIRGYFLWMIEDLFGELKRVAAEKMVPA